MLFRSLGVSGEKGIRGSRRDPVSGQCSVAHEQRSTLHRGGCGGVPLSGAALIRCARQVLGELLIRPCGSLGSVPDPRKRAWIAGENVGQCAMC